MGGGGDYLSLGIRSSVICGCVLFPTKVMLSVIRYFPLKSQPCTSFHTNAHVFDAASLAEWELQ